MQRMTSSPAAARVNGVACKGPQRRPGQTRNLPVGTCWVDLNLNLHLNGEKQLRRASAQCGVGAAAGCRRGGCVGGSRDGHGMRGTELCSWTERPTPTGVRSAGATPPLPGPAAIGRSWKFDGPMGQARAMPGAPHGPVGSGALVAGRRSEVVALQHAQQLGAGAGGWEERGVTRLHGRRREAARQSARGPDPPAPPPARSSWTSGPPAAARARRWPPPPPWRARRRPPPWPPWRAPPPPASWRWRRPVRAWPEARARGARAAVGCRAAARAT
jgi:hypothetical protein